MFVSGKLSLSQENDSCQDEGEQFLHVEVNDAGGGPFIRIKTGNLGWSMNSPLVTFSAINSILKTAEEINNIKDI
jgi:hypothetical protein